MKKKLLGILVCMLLIATSIVLTNSTNADWQPGDDHKMHFPQLPDADGWDVYATAGLSQYPSVVTADDFKCSESGYIRDIHFWGSWKGDIVGNILYFVIGIASDIPAHPPQVPYSRPGQTLVEWEIYDWVEAPPVDPPGMQGWYEPNNNYYIDNDHQNYFQYNVYLDEEDWFWQTKDTIYWLFISAVVEEEPTGSQPLWGWKTADVDQYPPPYTGKHFIDDACWAYWYQLDWQEILEPPILEPKTNLFWLGMNENSQIVFGGGTDYFEDGTSYFGWYYYEYTEWWNIWFYDHPFDPDRYKEVVIHLNWAPFNPDYLTYLELAVNWATDEWVFPGRPPVPPLTPDEEDLYIGRETLLITEAPQGSQILTFTIPWYNPEWISIDVRGYNFILLEGLNIIEHECLKSLDLAFVITGDEEINHPPLTPSQPIGPTTGKKDQSLSFTVSTTDPDGDQIYYWIEWGDGTNSGWNGPHASGFALTLSHTYTSKGKFQITVKAKDTHNAESDPSDPLEVEIKGKGKPKMLNIIESFLKNFSILEHILSKLIKYL